MTIDFREESDTLLGIQDLHAIVMMLYVNHFHIFIVVHHNNVISWQHFYVTLTLNQIITILTPFQTRDPQDIVRIDDQMCCLTF